MSYIPRLSHVVFTTLLSILFSYFWSIVFDSKTATVMLFAAGLFLMITVAILFSLLENAHYILVTNYIEALVKMDSDLRNALAFNIPSLRLIAKRGQVQTLFADTRATKEHIHLFLRESTSTSTASRRNWVTAERPRWAWDEIFTYLLNKKMVGEFAIGPDSYPWIGTAYQNLCIYFLNADIPNFNDNLGDFNKEME